ncbi:MAG: YggS family pyridoxal phosphate-dependent enzyme [Gemmatimonadales bacterium]
MDFPALEDNLQRVRDRIARAQESAGVAGPVTVLAVTKGHSADAIRATLRAGLTDIGENRVQEAVAKAESVGDVSVRWHLIGHLQSNKAKFVPGTFGMVQSVDSVKLVHALDRALARTGADLDVLLQINSSAEPQKSGCDPCAAGEIADAIEQSTHMTLQGVMTMAPLSDDERIVGRAFSLTREVRDELAASRQLPILSMGMSGDYELAIKEGANLVRLGTVLFGERPR